MLTTQGNLWTVHINQSIGSREMQFFTCLLSLIQDFAHHDLHSKPIFRAESRNSVPYVEAAQAGWWMEHVTDLQLVS